MDRIRPQREVQTLMPKATFDAMLLEAHRAGLLPTEEQEQFRRLFWRSGELYVRTNGVSLTEAEKLLADAGLRMPTYQEALLHASELRSTIALDNRCFFAKGKVSEKGGEFTYDENGELIDLKRGEQPYQRVHVYSSGENICIYVYQRGATGFAIYAGAESAQVQAVIGITP